MDVTVEALFCIAASDPQGFKAMDGVQIYMNTTGITVSEKEQKFHRLVTVSGQTYWSRCAITYKKAKDDECLVLKIYGGTDLYPYGITKYVLRWDAENNLMIQQTKVS